MSETTSESLSILAGFLVDDYRFGDAYFTEFLDEDFFDLDFELTRIFVEGGNVILQNVFDEFSCKGTLTLSKDEYRIILCQWDNVIAQKPKSVIIKYNDKKKILIEAEG